MVCQSTSIALNNGDVLYSLLGEEEEFWLLSLSNGSDGWQGKISKTELAAMASASPYTSEEYMNLFRKSFTLTSGDAASFIYKMSNQTDAQATLTWSSYLPKDKLTLKLGTINLARTDDFTTMNKSILESLVSKSRQQVEECDRLQTQLKQERAAADIALEKLNDYVTVQEESEKVLYANFVDVINEKKRKIRELTDECNSLRSELHLTETEASHRQSEDHKDEDSVDNSKQKKSAQPARKPRASAAVSACSKPKRSKNSKPRSRQVVYESNSETEEDLEEMEPDVKKAKPLSQTDDECQEDSDATDIDEAGVCQVSDQTGDKVELSSKISGPQSQKLQSVKSTDNSNSKTAATAVLELDDLLGKEDESRPERKISPVKRKDLSTVTTATPPKKPAPPAKRKPPARAAKNDDLSLLDDLL